MKQEILQTKCKARQKLSPGQQYMALSQQMGMKMLAETTPEEQQDIQSYGAARVPEDATSTRY